MKDNEKISQNHQLRKDGGVIMSTTKMNIDQAIMLDFDEDYEEVKKFFGEDITEERFEEIKFLHGLSSDEYEDWQSLMEHKHGF